MPTITVTVDVSDETADKISGLPEEKRVQITANALQNAVSVQQLPAKWQKGSTKTPAQRAEETAALFAAWEAEDKALGLSPEEAENEWRQLAARLNENRRVTGEEPLL